MCGAWRGWEQKTFYWHHAACRGRRGVCGLQKWRTCTSFLPGLSISWFLLNVLLLPAPSASSGFLSYHCHFLNLSAAAFFAHLIFSVPRHFLFFVFWLLGFAPISSKCFLPFLWGITHSQGSKLPSSCGFLELWGSQFHDCLLYKMSLFATKKSVHFSYFWVWWCLRCQSAAFE